MIERVDIKERLRSDLRPRRPLAPEWAYTALFTMLAALPAVVLLALGASGWRARAGLGLLPLFISIALAPLTGRALARLMAPGSEQSHSPRLLAAWLLAIPAALSFTAARAGAWTPGYPEWHCYSSGVLVALPTVVLGSLLLARGCILRRFEAAAAFGLLAGLAGYMALETGCGITGLPHLLASHYTVPASLSMAGCGLALVWKRG